MNLHEIKWEKYEEEHEPMLRGRLSPFARMQPRLISPRTRARLAEKRRLLKAQSQLSNPNLQGKDTAQFTHKPKPKSSRRATMRVPVGVGFWRTLKWIWTGK